MTSTIAQKSPEAFRTISEVADDIEIPQHVLRFWETKFASVKPLKRGGGRRYYRPDDIDLLRGIRALLYRDGLTIKGVQKILREHGPRYVSEMGRTSGGFIQTLRLVENAAARGGVDLMPETVHDDEAEAMPVEDASPRVKLEALLREVVALKARLRQARTRHF